MAMLICSGNIYAVKSGVNFLFRSAPHEKLTTTHTHTSVVWILKKKGREAYEPTSSTRFACTLGAAFSPCWGWIHRLLLTLLILVVSPRGVQCCSTTSLTTAFRRVLAPEGQWVSRHHQWLSQLMSNQLLMYMPHGKVIWLYQWSNFVIPAVQRKWEATQGTGKWPRSEAPLDCCCHISFATNQPVLAQACIDWPWVRAG